jgi:hypothetical protein
MTLSMYLKSLKIRWSKTVTTVEFRVIVPLLYGGEISIREIKKNVQQTHFRYS